MKVLTIGEDFGGATATAWTIWNYPGVKTIDGYELMKIMKEQAENYRSLLKDLGYIVIELEELKCCGNPARCAGYREDYENLDNLNI